MATNIGGESYANWTIWSWIAVLSRAPGKASCHSSSTQRNANLNFASWSVTLTFPALYLAVFKMIDNLMTSCITLRNQRCGWLSAKILNELVSTVKLSFDWIGKARVSSLSLGARVGQLTVTCRSAKMCFTTWGTMWGDLSAVNFRCKALEFHFRTSTIIIKLTITLLILLTKMICIAWWESILLVISSQLRQHRKSALVF